MDTPRDQDRLIMSIGIVYAGRSIGTPIAASRPGALHGGVVDLKVVQAETSR